MCCSSSDSCRLRREARLLRREQRREAKLARKMARYGMSPSMTPPTVLAPVPIEPTLRYQLTEAAPPSYSSINGSTGTRDISPTVKNRAGARAQQYADSANGRTIANEVRPAVVPFAGTACEKGYHNPKQVHIGGGLPFPFGLFQAPRDSRIICKQCGLDLSKSLVVQKQTIGQ